MIVEPNSSCQMQIHARSRSKFSSARKDKKHESVKRGNGILRTI